MIHVDVRIKCQECPGIYVEVNIEIVANVASVAVTLYVMLSR